MLEIKHAISILISSGTARGNITLLHCTTEYPAPIEEINLCAMRTMREKFGVKVGYSDHTIGIDVPLAAVALGAEVIEKHFTLDKKAKGPDHKASIDPEELKKMVESIRRIEKALGDGNKKAAKSEKNNIQVVRKSIFAARDIKKKQIISETDIICKRPAIGISPMKWDKIVNSVAKHDYAKGDLIR